MNINLNNVSEIKLEGRYWNSTYTNQWYKVTNITDSEIYFETQLGVRSARISALSYSNCNFSVKYKNPLIEKLNSL